MIPAGYEKNKKFDFSDSDYDDDADFCFDFADTVPVAIRNSETTVISNQHSSNFEKKVEQDPKYEAVYEVDNNYFYDDKKFILDDLQHAIINSNLQLVKEIFDKNNFDVNCIMKTNWIPIMYSVSVCSYEITEYLINKGANINYDDDSFSVLLCASGCIDNKANPLDLIKIVKLLINKGADVNSCDKYYQTPLMYACRSNNILLIDCLIDSGAGIDSQDDNNWTALSHASHKGHLKCVHKLLQLGADPTIYSYDYFYPFDLAQNAGYTDVKDLIKRFIRVKKLENIKNRVVDSTLSEISFSDDGFESLEEEDDMSLYQKKTSSSNDLEKFLNALNLNNLISNFKLKNITMIELLNFNENDLVSIGVSNSYTRELILYESKRFHLKNWKSSSLIPIRQDFSINCNEVIAIVSNLSRHTDYMSANVKYITSETKRSSSYLFADKFLSATLYTEIKETLKNSKQLVANVEAYCGLIEESVKDKKPNPVDLVEPKIKSWYSKPLYFAGMTTFGVTCVASTIYCLRKKFF